MYQYFGCVFHVSFLWNTLYKFRSVLLRKYQILISFSRLLTAWDGYSLHFYHASWTNQIAAPCKMLWCYHYPHRYLRRIRWAKSFAAARHRGCRWKTAQKRSHPDENVVTCFNIYFKSTNFRQRRYTQRDHKCVFGWDNITLKIWGLMSFLNSFYIRTALTETKEYNTVP